MSEPSSLRTPEDAGDVLAEKLRFLLGYYIDKHGAEMIRQAFRQDRHALLRDLPVSFDVMDGDVLLAALRKRAGVE